MYTFLAGFAFRQLRKFARAISRGTRTRNSRRTGRLLFSWWRWPVSGTTRDPRTSARARRRSIARRGANKRAGTSRGWTSRRSWTFRPTWYRSCRWAGSRWCRWADTDEEERDSSVHVAPPAVILTIRTSRFNAPFAYLPKVISDRACPSGYFLFVNGFTWLEIWIFLFKYQ